MLNFPKLPRTTQTLILLHLDDKALINFFSTSHYALSFSTDLLFEAKILRRYPNYSVHLSNRIEQYLDLVVAERRGFEIREKVADKLYRGLRGDEPVLLKILRQESYRSKGVTDINELDFLSIQGAVQEVISGKDVVIFLFNTNLQPLSAVKDKLLLIRSVTSYIYNLYKRDILFCDISANNLLWNDGVVSHSGSCVRRSYKGKFTTYSFPLVSYTPPEVFIPQIRGQKYSCYEITDRTLVWILGCFFCSVLGLDIFKVELRHFVPLRWDRADYTIVGVLNFLAFGESDRQKLLESKENLDSLLVQMLNPIPNLRPSLKEVAERLGVSCPEETETSVINTESFLFNQLLQLSYIDRNSVSLLAREIFNKCALLWKDREDKEKFLYMVASYILSKRLYLSTAESLEDEYYNLVGAFGEVVDRREFVQITRKATYKIMKFLNYKVSDNPILRSSSSSMHFFSFFSVLLDEPQIKSEQDTEVKDNTCTCNLLEIQD
jgi:serine/threonine protein kinase